MLLSLMLIFAVFACSTAVIMIKACTEHPLLVASYRLLIAVIVLLPFFIRDLKKHRKTYSWTQIRKTILPGLALALHFITWIIGARMTLAANSSLIVNMMPVAMPFFLFLFIKEIINKKEIIGTILAIMGVIILSYSDFHVNFRTVQGDILCFVAMVFLTLYLALGRKYRTTSSLWLYLVPLYFFAGISCFIISLFFINPIKPYTLNNVLFFLGLGIIPTVFGHSIINYCMRHMRGQIVSITNLGQFIFAGTMAYFLLGEEPTFIFYIACLFVVSGAVIVILFQKKGDGA